MHESKLAIMATGGMDSTTLLYMYAHAKPIPITVDYGHASFPKQVELLEYHIEKLNLPKLVIIKVHLEPWQTDNGLFMENYEPDEEKPLEGWDLLRYKDFFIEGRNMIMMAYVMAYCSKFHIDEIMTGYLYGEEEWEKRRTYKLMTGDNSPQFVDMMNLLSNVGLSYQVRIRAPFYEQRLSKKDVYKKGEFYKINWEKTHSCYFIPECGKCDNCLLRKEILK